MRDPWLEILLKIYTRSTNDFAYVIAKWSQCCNRKVNIFKGLRNASDDVSANLAYLGKHISLRALKEYFNNNYGITAHLYQIEGIDYPSLSRSRL